MYVVLGQALYTPILYWTWHARLAIGTSFLIENEFIVLTQLVIWKSRASARVSVNAQMDIFTSEK